MNRLVILGNGFDLAHGLNTRYYDFLLEYLRKGFQYATENKLFEDELIMIKRNDDLEIFKDLNSENLNTFLDYAEDVTSQNLNTSTVVGNVRPKIFTLSFKNNFVRDLFTECNECNWVDIEQNYYNQIADIFNSSSNERRSAKIKTLNDSFEHLKDKLQSYIGKQNEKLGAGYFLNDIYSIFRRKINYEDNINLTQSEFQENVQYYPDRKPVSTHILNFNYTDTIRLYTKNGLAESDIGPVSVNHIHGNVKNEIVFGFGDELDDLYERIEKQNDNEFLRHFKSFFYFRNKSYYELIKFIDIAIYEIYIMGHSCGLSDRTLLNMIFEHNNCKGIKIFYHKKDATNNNYTELTHEISRHFKDKQLMRRLIFSIDPDDFLPQRKA